MLSWGVVSTGNGNSTLRWFKWSAMSSGRQRLTSSDCCASSSHQSSKVGQMLGPSGGPTPAQPMFPGSLGWYSHLIDSVEEGPPLSGKGNILAPSTWVVEPTSMDPQWVSLQLPIRVINNITLQMLKSAFDICIFLSLFMFQQQVLSSFSWVWQVSRHCPIWCWVPSSLEQTFPSMSILFGIWQGEITMSLLSSGFNCSAFEEHVQPV